MLSLSNCSIAQLFAILFKKILYTKGYSYGEGICSIKRIINWEDEKRKKNERKKKAPLSKENKEKKKFTLHERDRDFDECFWPTII